MFKDMDFPEKMFSVVVGVIVTYFVSLICMYTFSAKEFKGYYLQSHSGIFTIQINWENAPDEQAYSSYNQEEVLRVFKKLQSEKAYQPQ